MKTTHAKKGRNDMKTRTTIAFSCPQKTADLIDEYSARYGISRSACITMMCNAFSIADSTTAYRDSDSISDQHKEAFERV